MDTTILFIGNFLSLTRGSYAVSEFIADRIAEESGIGVIKVSNAENRMVRLIEILWASLFKSYTLMHVDVFSANSFLFARMAAAVGKMRKKKVVLTLHGGALHEHYKGRETSFRILFKNAHVQSPSHFLKSFFEQQQFVVTYVPNPVQLQNFPFQRDHVRPYSLLWVRAFAKIYNPAIPVRVLHKIIQEFPEATLSMIGPDKGLLKETKALIKRLNLVDRVTITGPVPNDILHTWYQSHAVCLNTTSYESFGVAVVEAASCGVPIVSFNVGEIPNLWTNDKNILLCELNDVDKMVILVKKILSDSGLSNRLALNARKRAEEFSWDNVRMKWIELLNL